MPFFYYLYELSFSQNGKIFSFLAETQTKI